MKFINELHEGEKTFRNLFMQTQTGSSDKERKAL